MEVLTVIGGGSAYTPGLLQALISHAGELPLRVVRLYDLDAERLRIVGALGAAMAGAAGVFKVEVAASLAEAVRGAGLVLNSSRPGGLEARRLDETLPLEFGMPGQETVGPGGFFYALRSVPEALRLARTVAEVAPGATILNYTNPSNIVTQALADLGVAVVGMCDQSDEDLAALAQALGRPPRYAFRCNGLNHATWYADVVLDGLALAELPAPGAAPQGLDEEHRLRFTFAAELARENPGYWPNSYVPYYRYPEAFVELSKRIGPRSDVVAASLPRYYAHFAAESTRARPQLRTYRGAAGFGDLAVAVIRALSSPEPRSLVLNLPNQGATEAFARDTVVETRVRVSSRGIERDAAPAMPASFADLAARLERYQRTTARAAAGRSVEAWTAALAANPLVGGEEKAAKLIARALEAYGGLLPVPQ